MPLVRFGLRGYPGYLAVYAAVRIDQAFIGPLLGSRQLGFYAISASVAILPATLARSIGARSFATVAGASSDDRADLISRYVRLTILGAVMTSASIAVVAPVLVPLLYGKVFAEAVLPLLLLLPGSVFLCGSLTAAAGLTAIGRPGQTTIAELVGVGVTVLGLPVVLPRLGIVGAAGISTLAYMLTFGTYRIFLRRIGPMRVWPYLSDLRWLAGVTWQFLRRIQRRSVLR